MANRDLVKSYTAEADLDICLFVKPGAADYGMLPAAAATDAIIGVTGPVVAADSGESVDVIHGGIADLQLGGTVTRGDLLTADASGKGVTAAPATGANARYGAVALVSGVSGDIIPVLITLGSIQG
nr:capsid cement protein [uncultured Holophaga sp.]